MITIHIILKKRKIYQGKFIKPVFHTKKKFYSVIINIMTVIAETERKKKNYV